MNISKALKVKSRLTSQLADLDRKIQTNNVVSTQVGLYKKPVYLQVDKETTIVKETSIEYYAMRVELINRIIKLKTAIAVANAPILSKLEILAQAKATITLLTNLKCSPNIYSINVEDGRDPIRNTINYKHEQVIDEPSISDEQRQKLIADQVKLIEDSQDAIDDYNAKTKLNGLEGFDA